MAVFSKRAEQEAESLAAQIATVERATDHRRRLTGMAREATGLLDDPGGVTTSQITATRDGVAEATEALDAAVTRAAAALDPLSFKLTRTRHRGIYRSGERYLVPFVDDLGADRSRDFDSLSDARAFRATVRIAEGRQARIRAPMARRCIRINRPIAGLRRRALQSDGSPFRRT
jgi:hypothetical protein